jgi:hypothetical protein
MNSASFGHDKIRPGSGPEQGFLRLTFARSGPYTAHSRGEAGRRQQAAAG